MKVRYMLEKLNNYLTNGFKLLYVPLNILHKIYSSL